MREPGTAIQVAEKIAGIISIVAALIVLNGAWQNQHNWENLSWRIAMATVLLALAVIVETRAIELLQTRWSRPDEVSVPSFLRAAEPAAQAGAAESAPEPVEEAAEVGGRR